MLIHQGARLLLVFLFRLKELLARPWATYRDFPVQAGYYPTGFGVEVTNLCNADCIFCAYQYRERPVTFMPFETFRKIIDQYVALGDDKAGIGLTPVVGDPLIDKDLVRKMTYASSFPQIKNIHMTTNAILLTRERFDKLVDAGLNMITVSLGGFSREEYKRIYRKDQYVNVVKNLRAVAASERFRKCAIEIGLRTSALFPQRTVQYKEFRSLGYKISRNWFFDNWSGRIKQKYLHQFMFLRPDRKNKRVPCGMLYQGPHALANGDVTACGCRDLEGNSDLKLGNIQESSLADILTPGKMESLRRRFIEGNLPDICRDCKHYFPMSLSTHERYKREFKHEQLLATIS